MKKLDSTAQTSVLILAYWPRRQRDELNVGYGMTKFERFCRIAGAVVSVSSTLFNLLFEAKTRPALRPAVRLLPFTFAGLTLALLTARFRQYRGYYQLDDQGMPIAFVSRVEPDVIKGRLGMGQEKFLEKLASAE